MVTSVPITSAQAVDGLHLKTFAAENENNQHSRTRQQALEDAKNFDVISALPGTYRTHIAAMRAANPSLVVLAYMNGTFAQKSQGSAYPNDWYARDRDDNKIRSNGYGNYLMRPDGADWISDRVSKCRALLQQTGYNGCMVDMVGTAPVVPGYLTALPINPATGSPWTASQWQRATAALVGTMVTVIPEGVIWGNGFGSGVRYFAEKQGPSSVLGPSVAGALTEVWMRTAQMPITKFQGEAAWRQSVDMLVDLGRTGGRTSVMVKLWAKGTNAQKDAYHRYALASFLLGSDGKSSFSLSYDHNADVLARHAYWSRTDIGSPSGAYTQVNGVYQRTFTRGKVLVNPTSTTRTLSLGGKYTDLLGNTRTSITLLPNSGDVLRLAG